MRLVSRLLLLCCLGLAALAAPAADYRLVDGTVISGEPIAPRDSGVVIRRATGGVSDRIPWERFAPESLKEMAKDPQFAEFVEVHVALAEGAELGPDGAIRQPLELKPVPGKLERPARRPTLFAALGTPIGLFIVAVLLAANLYAAYEVAVFRNYPAAAVMGTALILPVLGPVIFLCLPTRVGEAAAAAGEFAAPEDVVNDGAEKLAAAGLSGGGLAIGAPKQAAAAAGAGQAFRRGEVEFNRRFFESQYPPFFRLVKGEADKNLLLHVKAGRQEYIATRITRISGLELGLQLQIGREVLVKFEDVTEVQARPKE